MAGRFANLSIRHKLVLITLASTGSALLLAAGGFFAWDLFQYRREIERDLRSQARTIAENSTAPLVFADPRVAGETLAVLGVYPQVRRACMFAAEGQLFATFFRSSGDTCGPLPADAVEIGWRRARIVAPVTLDDRRIGTVVIERDQSDVLDRLIVGGGILTVLFILATIVAVLIGGRMQRTVADPLLQLAETARAVSQSHDYSLRATARSDDEVGIVVEAFNDMLARVQAQTSELSQANRLKDEFLATLSHELRTPLNAVLGWTRVMRSPHVQRATQERALDSIERNARLQTRMIEDLLEVSRIVSGKLKLQLRPIDLAAVVDAALDVVQPGASAKHITITRDLAGRPCMIVGDPDRLQQVVWNLLSNAVKFTPESGSITIRVDQNNGCGVTVIDTGIGIDPAFAPHIFERFRQADASPSREHGGLGLGLAIVRHLVELHGGHVFARSDGPGRGATFEVRLPSGPATAPAADHAEPQRGAATALHAPVLSDVDVLVVDDDVDARELLLATLDSYGANVAVAASAAEALSRLEHSVPDVIISDIGMPAGDGYWLIRQIRSRPPSAGGQVPAVALTAYASPADREAALAAGFQAHLAKPFEPSELAAVVRGITNGVT